jgi:ATP-dependent DNA helicase DinG
LPFRSNSATDSYMAENTFASLAFPALHASHSGTYWANAAGEVRGLSKGEAVARAAESPFLLINAPLLGQRLGYAELSGLDLLELFAFVHPARFCVPSASGLAKALGLPVPAGENLIPAFCQQAAARLIETLGDPDWAEREGAWDAAMALQKLRWHWAGVILAALPTPAQKERWLFSKLPEWEDAAPPQPPRTIVLETEAIAKRLAHLTGDGAEPRPGQNRYADASAAMFAPRERRGAPHILLAQAGTGIGKTLGYLATADLWTRASGGQVWISTFTKALQRQLAAETARLYPNPVDHKTHVVVRKGRENYLCLLNLEDALQGGFAGRAAVLAHLVARWAAFTRDGDMVGGDMPGWLPSLFRRNGTTALTDRRGECIYAGCPHFKTCFIERASRASAGARIVVANHALVILQAARGAQQSGKTASTLPQRIVFDEGHHVFDAADSMFSIALTGQEVIELRRWLLGPERGSRGRRRGLAARLMDVASYDAAGDEAINSALRAAQSLVSDGWLARIAEANPLGPIEALLAAVRATVFARDAQGEADTGYGLETELAQPDGALVEAATAAADAFAAVLTPLIRLGTRLEALLTDGPDWLDGAARARIDGALASLSVRIDTLQAWIALLARVGGPADSDFVDWLAVARFEARELDVGLHRHWLDPSRPFAQTVLKPAHGVMITSATLSAGERGLDYDAYSPESTGVDWGYADARAGVPHLDVRALHFAEASPFDYARQSEVLIVTDVPRGDMPALAGAYGRLIVASQGGALGLFSAIRRLRSIHARIADRLAREGLPVFAQHVDPMDTGTLVDMFRDDPLASLLGTDALRDGVDVPGESLRLVVMEGVPWPKPTVLHAARKLAGGGREYEERLIRARLAQAFGRLVRRQSDMGQFVLLSAAMPSRLLSAFPPATPVSRVSLDEAVARVVARNSARNAQRANIVAEVPAGPV